MAGWTQRWRIDSREKLARVVAGIARVPFDPARPLELILRTERKEKTGAQRALFHAVCAELAPHLGETPGQVKLRIKADFYGVEVRHENGTYYGLVPSSEDSDREEYTRLIDHVYQFAAKAGVFLQDQRPK